MPHYYKENAHLQQTYEYTQSADARDLLYQWNQDVLAENILKIIATTSPVAQHILFSYQAFLVEIY